MKEYILKITEKERNFLLRCTSARLGQVLTQSQMSLNIIQICLLEQDRIVAMQDKLFELIDTKDNLGAEI